MKKIGVLLVGCLLSLNVMAQAGFSVPSSVPAVTVVPHHDHKTWDRVVATVRLPGQPNEVIMQSALDDQAAAEAKAQNVSVGSLTPDNYNEVLDEMIDQTLLAQKARTLSWNPQQINELTQGFILQRAQQAGLLVKGATFASILNQMAVQTGLSGDDIVSQVRTQIEIRQMVQQYLAQMIPAPSAESIADYQKNHPVPPLVVYDYLTKLFPFGSAQSTTAKAATAHLAADYVAHGKFQHALEQVQAATALPPELQEVVPALQPGQVFATPITTPAGDELVKLIKVEKQAGAPLSKAQAIQGLQQQQVPQLIKQLVANLRKQAKIEIALN
jgi:hypothetical protein